MFSRIFFLKRIIYLQTDELIELIFIVFILIKLIFIPFILIILLFIPFILIKYLFL
jgi:hypothetical protein